MYKDDLGQYIKITHVCGVFQSINVVWMGILVDFIVFKEYYHSYNHEYKLVIYS